MSAFTENDHPRAGDGKFAAKPPAPESGIDLRELAYEGARAKFGGAIPADYERQLDRELAAVGAPGRRDDAAELERARSHAADLVRAHPQIASIGLSKGMHTYDGFAHDGRRFTLSEDARQDAQELSDHCPEELWKEPLDPQRARLEMSQVFGPDPDDELGGPNLPLSDPPGPTVAGAGKNTERAMVGLPGHCEKCAQYGHIAAHPEYGCGDVGCSGNH